VRAQRLLAGSARKDVRPLTTEEAVADGSELLSEAFVFAVAAAVVTNEYVTSARKATAKAEELDRTLDQLGASVSTLEQVRHTLKKNMVSVITSARSLSRAGTAPARVGTAAARGAA
jgi:hypothetical protein